MVTKRYFDQRERFTENPEIFTYDDLSQEFRYKVAYAFKDLYEFLTSKMAYPNEELPEQLWKRQIVRALGIPSPPQSITVYLATVGVPEFFRGVEVFLEAAFFSAGGALYGQKDECHSRLGDAVHQINKVMLYYALGYEIVVPEGDREDEPIFQVIRKDTQFTHEEMVKPALRLVGGEEFRHAEEQFRDAHREFQQGHYADSITDASSSVESVLKVVLGVDEGTAKELLKKAAEEGYFPGYLADSVGQWVNLFVELPTVRNRFGDAHGKSKNQPDEAEMERLARLALNLAASHILFIINEYRRRGKSGA
jgi:HEPN domain-containing protein